jgi:hypothetical protein
MDLILQITVTQEAVVVVVPPLYSVIIRQAPSHAYHAKVFTVRTTDKRLGQQFGLHEVQ